MLDWVEEWRIELGLLLAGVVLIGYGVYSYWGVAQRAEVAVEADKRVEVDKEREIVVEVSGEVVRPGVYELKLGQRVGEALEMAGGLTANADHERVALAVNKAERLKDGQKIYIPPKKQSNLDSNQESGLISINQASRSELESLPGVGPVTAEKIVNSRPYTSIEELKSKGVLGEKQFAKLVGLISL